MGNTAVWGVGMMCVYGALVLMLVTASNWLWRYISAYMNRTEKPKDRIILKIILAGLAGAVIGGFAQPQWDKGERCREFGGNPIRCVFTPV